MDYFTGIARGWTESNRGKAILPTLAILLALCAAPVGNLLCQQAPAKPETSKPSNPNAPAQEPPEEDDEPPAGDWGPELLYGILNSPNEEAQFGLLRAAFAAGPAIIPQLDQALADDRTAEFAAQSIAYIGTDQALPILEKLLNDKRDLDLRRFTYGALGEFPVPLATNILFDAIDKSDSEPDRTVTEAAIIALTVRTDPSIPARLADSENKLQDVVIRDDLENARMVISERAKFLASDRGKTAGGSVDAAVRTYFLPALESADQPQAPPPPTVPKYTGKKPAAPAIRAPKLISPIVRVEVRSVTLSPDKSRALARVLFEDATAVAFYDFVLQKREGNWGLASVWLGPEVERPSAETKAPDTPDDNSDAGTLK